MSDTIIPTLPPKSTPLQRAIVQACAPLGEAPVPIRTLWNPDHCPVDFLPFLAWALSVDRWDDAWPVDTKRAAIKASYYIHRKKGTVAAVRRVVETLGFLIEVEEWWQADPKGPRGTFALKVGVRDSGITEEMFQEMERLIEDAKPKSRHMTGLQIQLEVRTISRMAVAAYLGDVLTVYPYTPGPIAVAVVWPAGVRVHLADTLTVHPLTVAS